MLFINFDKRWEINIFGGSLYGKIDIFSSFEFCLKRQTKHIFCHFKHTDNCTASFSSQLKKSWFGIFLDSKLHMYASKYNVHSGQKNCQLRKIINSILFLLCTIIVTSYNLGLLNRIKLFGSHEPENKP